MPSTTSVAAVQYRAAHGNKDANIAAIERLARAAVREGAELIVAPEMATTGLVFSSRDEVVSLAEPIPGSTTARLTALANELGCWLVVGMPEIDLSTGILYNSAVLVGPLGVIGRHRKVHLFPSDTLWASEGDLGFGVWDTPIGSVGVMICMDANFPESSRALAQAGATILAMPAGWGPESCPSPYWRARAFECELPLVCSNPLGAEGGYRMSGGSCVLDPDGSVRAVVSGAEGLAIARVRNRLPAQQPDWLSRFPGLLLSHRFLFDPESLGASLGRKARSGTHDAQVAVCRPHNDADVSWRDAADAWIGTLRRPPDLLILPSQTVQGPSEEAARAETIPGPTTRSLTELSLSVGSLVAVGLSETCGDGAHETLVLLGPSGLLGRRRMGHRGELSHAADPPLTVDTPIGSVGLLSARELMNPGPARLMALLGADFLCVPASTDEIPNEASDWRLPAVRAAENDVVVAVANNDFRAASSIDGVSGFTFEQAHSISNDARATGVSGATLLITRRGRAGRQLRDKPKLARRVPLAYRPVRSL